MKNYLPAVFIIIICASSLMAQKPPASLSFHYQGMKINAPEHGSKVDLAPIIQLIGGELSFSEAAGVWAISMGDHLIQLSPGRKLLLIDGKLMEAVSAPQAILSGIAVSQDYLKHYILAPLGLHLETIPSGIAIREGATFGEPLGVHPILADFGATTTLVLALDEKAETTIKTDQQGQILVQFPNNSPQLDTSRHFKSKNILSLQAGVGHIEIKPSSGIGLISQHILHNPERVVLELGKVQPTPTPAPQQAPPPPLRRHGPPVIVIDPGHGGSDTGAIGPTGLVEKTLTLDVARALATQLRSDGYSVRMTRENDEGRALSDRAALANRLEAKLFISLHANSSTAHSVRGAETYYMSLNDGASDAAAQSTADLENSASRSENHKPSSLDLILWDMAQSEVLNESAKLALDIQLRLNTLLGIKDRGVKQAPFVVLTGATMPAALVEVGFLSNRDEAALLSSKAHQQSLAHAIALGIQDFLGKR